MTSPIGEWWYPRCRGCNQFIPPDKTGKFNTLVHVKTVSTTYRTDIETGLEIQHGLKLYYSCIAQYIPHVSYEFDTSVFRT